MELVLRRHTSFMDATIGELFLNGAFECFTLEDTIREVPNKPVSEWKIASKTAIPTGTYKVIIDFSNRFQRKMLHILNVEGFDGIRIHAGNTSFDTEGCILVGKFAASTTISVSRSALAQLQDKVQKALDAGENVNITIINGE